MSSYEFTPIPNELADALDRLAESCGPDGGMAPADVRQDAIDELRALGFLDDVRAYYDGDCRVRVAARGMRYRDELAAWEERRDEAGAAEERAGRRASRREWVIGILGVAATVFSGLAGYLIGSAGQ